MNNSFENPYAPSQASTLSDVGVDLQEGHRPASRLSRLFANLLDGLLVAAAVIPGSIFLAFEAKTLGGFLVLLGFGLYAYLTLRRMYVYGQTYGKKWMGIKVVRSNGESLGLVRWLLLRSFVPSLVGFVPVIGSFLPLVGTLLIFGQARRCLHDLVCDTIVVDA